MPFLTEPFRAIQQRPCLYFGDSPPLSALFFFIQGSRLGQGSGKTSPLELPHDFEGWVAYRTGASRSLNWLGMLLSVSGNEAEAFRRFFGLLEEYEARRGKLIARITGHGRAHPGHGPELNPGPSIHPLPDPILLSTYTIDAGFLATTGEGISFGIWGYWKSWEEIAEREGFTLEHVEILDEDEFARVRTQE